MDQCKEILHFRYFYDLLQYIVFDNGISKVSLHGNILKHNKTK
jgi:hypothetical protein